MRKRDSLTTCIGFRKIVTVFASAALPACLLLGVAHGQTVTAPSSANASKAAPPATGENAWLTLAPKQKVSLSPLEKSWNALSDGQRRKWLAISESYPSLGQAEQEKLHSRMAEWAALSPKDREAARLNFAQSKTMPKSDRSANWEAYQALSPDEREKLAQGAKAKPVGAAVAVKPVAYPAYARA
jgi:hypothetical protein